MKEIASLHHLLLRPLHMLLKVILSESPAVTDQPAINSHDDIWACWKLYINDNFLHKYSLERLGIIQCGNKVRCRDWYSPELYNLLIYESSTSINPVSNNACIFDPIFSKTFNKLLMLKKIRQNSL
ncbi:unnamed protein product [Rhizopus stolonifer]